MKRNGYNYAIITIGLILLGVGLYLVKSTTEPQGIMRAMPYICIGIGCGSFGHGMGNVISNKAIKSNLQVAKQIEIDVNDERNISIRDKSKAKAYDMMIFIFGALMLSFALMGVDMMAILLFVFAYLFVVGYGVYYRFKYDKEM